MLDAINDGEVEYPERMTFMQWLAWRKSTGTRPLKKKDGGSSSLEEENKLWKEVMEFLHDAGEEELEEEEEEEDEEEASEAPHPAAGRDLLVRLSQLGRYLPQRSRCRTSSVSSTAQTRNRSRITSQPFRGSFLRSAHMGSTLALQSSIS